MPMLAKLVAILRTHKFCTSLALGNPNLQLAPCYLAQYAFLIKRSLFAWTPPSCLFCGFFRSRTFTQPVKIATFAVKYSSYRVITSICSPKLSFTGIKTRLCRSAGRQIFDNLTPFCRFFLLFLTRISHFFLSFIRWKTKLKWCSVFRNVAVEECWIIVNTQLFSYCVRWKVWKLDWICWVKWHKPLKKCWILLPDNDQLILERINVESQFPEFSHSLPDVRSR